VTTVYDEGDEEDGGVALPDDPVAALSELEEGVPPAPSVPAEAALGSDGPLRA